MDELANKSEGKEVKKQDSFFHVLMSCNQKVWSSFRVGLSASNNLLRKALIGVPSSLGFS